MASTDRTTTLYTQTCNLGIVETYMARDLFEPFKIKDRPRLRSQAGDVADAARKFRLLDPAKISDARITTALQAVGAASAYFANINHSLTTGFTQEDVFAATQASIDAVLACA